MAKKFLDENGLLYYNQKIQTKFDEKVNKEYKTNSKSEYKVLSDNNLTDELLAQINKSVGSYNDLTDKPAIDGKELSSTSTAGQLGLAKKTDIPDTSDFLTETTANDLYIKSEDVQGTIVTSENLDSTLTDYATKNFVTGKGYQTSSDVDSLITSKGYATETYVNNKVSSVYKYIGTVSTYSDLSEKEDTANVGDVYNVESDGQNYAWTGSAWDSLGATIDLSNYVKTSDLVEITNQEIDSIFAS